MKDRVLQENARGSGRSVHAIQQMPAAKPRNTDTTMAAITTRTKG
jgi:dihydroorotase